ncbi:zinc ABC transporter substrate-binding protein ZnuA [Vibrio cholerae]|uniref:High-affinity zinc uptake system protein ZnuA n=1 Tax=Vibrio metoecus TaxID=1481663 RepID=A0A0Q0QEX2_VIBMT|nr:MULTISPECIES: zinc ABC transporter substrate-binding protein ZnuA [Vibrio]EGQ8494518.1 zinc ABC transporter substrate-binding protein ZnuA [Vibrio cholerae]EGR0605241.1 zinc ABC transporter substrate-binding protein ZnuA [Vibrio cholerae]EGR3934138.1 zinc ABC transporter substrate-binding protein ZnuA [Vibrio cholerae]EGR4231941.1 zinc ABC transporter substrate-binding protein ZnuA [Vibrio cholerae]EII5640527.1 zinc ABC transporter substrate-binding protein ZnuA [Vibrio cholerae]
MLPRFVLLSALSLFSQMVSAIEVLTSIKPIQMITYELMLGSGTPDVLLPSGASPHDYALRPSDVKRIQQADLVIWFGQDLEPFMSKLLVDRQSALTLSQAPNLVLREYNEEGEHDHDGHHHGSHDPHFWLGIEQAGQVARVITARLIALDEVNQQLYQANLVRFLTSLAEHDNAIGEKLKPVTTVPYYVFHDAYGYFEQHFALNNLGHFTVSPERKPGAKTLIAIKQTLNSQLAKCVFAEPQFEPAIIDTVVRGTPAKIGVLDPLGSSIELNAGSYFVFLNQLADSYYGCLSQS